MSVTESPGGFASVGQRALFPWTAVDTRPCALALLMATINPSRVVLAKPIRSRNTAHGCRIAGSPRDPARPMRAGRTSRTTRLLIADHQELIRLGLSAMLAGESGLSISGEAGTLAEAVAETRRVRPDLVLLDAHLPGGSGAEACRLLLKAHSRVRILIMTQEKSTAAFRQVLKAGAHGFVCKDSRHAELLLAIRLMALGDANANSMGMSRVSSARRRDGTQSLRSKVSLLSPQERRILPLLAEGKTNHEIALELALAKVTVKNYLANMFKKLNVGRRSHAVAVYLQAQLHGTR